MNGGRVQFLKEIHWLILVLFIYQNCGRFHADLESSSLPGMGDYNFKAESYTLSGRYQEYLAEDFEHYQFSVISAIEDDDHHLYQFDKKLLPAKVMQAISIGDHVQLEIQNDSIFQKHMATKMQKQGPDHLPIQVRPLTILKNNKTEKTVLKTEFVSATGEGNYKVAFVYMDFQDFRADESNLNMPEEVIESLMGSTWGKFQVQTSIADIYRMSVKRNFAGCDGWNYFGQEAINYVNGALKKNYARVVAIIPSPNALECPWGGITSSGQSYKNPIPVPVVLRANSSHVAAHEIGHTLGLGHSAHLGLDVYSDDFDVMGRGNGLNVSKLMDLGVLKPGNGLEIAQAQAQSQYFNIFGRSTDIFATGKTIAVGLDNFLVSLTENSGLTVHLRTGAGADGNTPSSFEMVNLKPGESWTYKNKRWKVQFVRWDLITNQALIKINGEDDPSGGYVGGCLIHHMWGSDLTYLNPYTDADFGFLQFKPGVIGAVGDCNKEKLQVIISPENDDLQLIAAREIEVDLSLHEQKKTLIPYFRKTASNPFKVKIQINHGPKILYEKFFDLSTEPCPGGGQNCLQKSSCQLPVVANIWMDRLARAANQLYQGDLILANPNAKECGLGQYSVEVTQENLKTPTNLFYTGEVSFGENLNNLVLTESDSLLRKKIFILAGESLRIPVKIVLRPDTLDVVLRFSISSLSSSNTQVRNLVKFSASDSYDSSVNMFTDFGDINLHPFRPQALTAYNRTGLITSMPASCQVQTFTESGYRDLNQISLFENESLRLKVESQYSNFVEYNCNNRGWKSVVLNASKEQEFANLKENTTCLYRAVQLNGTTRKYTSCAPNAGINVNILSREKVTCVSPSDSVLNRFSLTANMAVSDIHKGQQGFYFIMGKTQNDEWYSFNGMQWLNGQASMNAQSTELSAFGPLALFNQLDLTAFAGGQIYLGYGLGASELVAKNEMQTAKRIIYCSTIK